MLQSRHLGRARASPLTVIPPPPMSRSTFGRGGHIAFYRFRFGGGAGGGLHLSLQGLFGVEDGDTWHARRGPEDVVPASFGHIHPPCSCGRCS